MSNGSPLGKLPKGVRPLGYEINGGTIPDERDVLQGRHRAFTSGSSTRSITLVLFGQAGDDLAAGAPTMQSHTLTLAIGGNAPALPCHVQ